MKGPNQTLQSVLIRAVKSLGKNKQAHKNQTKTKATNKQTNTTNTHTKNKQANQKTPNQLIMSSFGLGVFTVVISHIL